MSDSARVAAAHQLFDEMPNPNVVSRTSLMAGYVGMVGSIVLLQFRAVSSCSQRLHFCSCDQGLFKKLCAYVEIFYYGVDVMVCCLLLDTYGKCNDVKARRVFDSMSYKIIVFWTSMIAADAQNAHGNHLFRVFVEFSCSSFEHPNPSMYASVISAYVACVSCFRNSFAQYSELS